MQRDQDLPGEAKEPKEAMEKGEDSEDAKDNGEDDSGEWVGVGEIKVSTWCCKQVLWNYLCFWTIELYDADGLELDDNVRVRDLQM